MTDHVSRDEVIKVLEDMIQGYQREGDYHGYATEMRAAIKAVRALPAARGKPVAWMWRIIGEGDDRWALCRIGEHTKRSAAHGYETRALFDHPQAAQGEGVQMFGVFRLDARSPIVVGVSEIDAWNCAADFYGVPNADREEHSCRPIIITEDSRPS